MASNFDKISPITETSDEYLYAIIERLKAQKALPQDSFIKELPFFSFSSISTKESQIKELFQDVSDMNFHKTLMKNMISLSQQEDSSVITKRISAMQVMGFAQISLYKVLLCKDKDCSNRPREVAPRNQYKDYEYSCPFYHHDKDKRRIVIPQKIEGEFNYKANYWVEGKGNEAEKEQFSMNYFESMFHPLYYKMFKCKRDHCNFSQFCPYYHSEDEKRTWDNIFSNFIRKDRVSYVKDKRKYLECNTSNTNKFSDNYIKSPKSCYQRPFGTTQNGQIDSKNPYSITPLNKRPKNEWNIERKFEINSAGKWNNRKTKKSDCNKKDSAELFDEDKSLNNFEVLCDSKENFSQRIC